MSLFCVYKKTIRKKQRDRDRLQREIDSAYIRARMGFAEPAGAEQEEDAAPASSKSIIPWIFRIPAPCANRFP